MITYQSMLLQTRVDKDKVNARLRGLYKYARDKGFGSRQANYLSHFNKATIDRIAQERDAPNHES